MSAQPTERYAVEVELEEDVTVHTSAKGTKYIKAKARTAGGVHLYLVTFNPTYITLLQGLVEGSTLRLTGAEVADDPYEEGKLDLILTPTTTITIVQRITRAKPGTKLI
ncbi:MAG: hypothetical protein QW688_08340 [Thermoprotei archaeon]